MIPIAYAFKSFFSTNSNNKVNKAWKIVPETAKIIIINLNFLVLSNIQDIIKEATVPMTLAIE